MRPIHLTALAAAFLVFCTSTARAGTVQRLSLSDLAERADLAFEGHVLSARVLEPAPGRIETEYALREDRAFVGQPCGLRVVRIPGGVLPDGRGLAIAGLPRMDVGEDVVLFLSREGSRGTRLPLGLAQGKLRVAGHGSARRLIGEVAGLDFVGQAPTAVPAGAGIDYVTALAEIEAGLAARAAGARR